ncbi:MAG TPA: ABC transporter substrate-binding protein [Streptosporangiaceae bacterium]|jgi:ABC-type branched-subunit amino acid transport system substrate-binding protein
MSKHRTRHLIAIGGIAVLGLAACSSSGGTSAGSSSPASSTTAPSTVTATGSTIYVGEISPIDEAALAVPEVSMGVRTAVRAINASGGVLGHKVVLVYCNDQDNPTVAGQCANEMVSKHVVAMVGDFTLFGAVVNPILEKAGIPEIGGVPEDPSDYKDPNIFLIDGGETATLGGVALLFKKLGITSIVAPRIDVPATITDLATLKKAISSLGISLGQDILVPPTATDFSPYVQAAISSKAEGIYFLLAGAQIVPYEQLAVQLGAQYKIVDGQGTLTNTDIAELAKPGGPLDNSYLVQSLPPLTAASQYPGIQTFLSQLNAEHASGDAEATTLQASADTENAWLSTWALEKVLSAGGSSSGGAVTASSVMKAMQSAQNVSLFGLTPPWTPNKTITGAWPRISNPYQYFLVMKNGTSYLSQKAPVDTTSQIQ